MGVPIVNCVRPKIATFDREAHEEKRCQSASCRENCKRREQRRICATADASWKTELASDDAKTCRAETRHDRIPFLTPLGRTRTRLTVNPLSARSPVCDK